MVHAFLIISRYLLIIIMALYVFYSFTRAFRGAGRFQEILVYLFHLLGNLNVFIYYPKDTTVIFYGAQLVFLILLMELFPAFYENAKRDILYHMGMMISISFIIINRLDLTTDDTMAVRQFALLSLSFVIFCLIPLIYCRIKEPQKLGPVCFVAGLAAIGVVMVMGTVTMGAKLSLDFGPISLQPSEFVKITYVFFLAAYLARRHDFKHICISAVLAGSHVLVLVISTDLGAALIFAISYLMMIYCASGRKRYLLAGGVLGSFASVGAYFMFSHVQERVVAWLDPWSVIDDAGYQVTQSLFAIGTGGFLGSGLFEGSPEYIPVVYKDFIFSAIAEEFGGFFAILLILLYLNCFLSMIMIGMQQTTKFGKLLMAGFCSLLATQIFLAIGGNIKMIPSTGVTLPLISYGGSSALATMIMFGITEALAMMIGGQDGKKEKRSKGRRGMDIGTDERDSLEGDG